MATTYNLVGTTGAVETVCPSDLSTDIRDAWDVSMARYELNIRLCADTGYLAERRKEFRQTVWTARCKSGYQYRVAGEWKTCSRVTGRGQLMCQDCKDAQVLESGSDEQTVFSFGRLSPVVRTWAKWVVGGIR